MLPVRHTNYIVHTFAALRGLDGLSDEQIAEHLQLYAGYVRQVNALTDELDGLRERGRASARDLAFAELTRRLGFEYDGMILHEYYFANLRANADPSLTPRRRSPGR